MTDPTTGSTAAFEPDDRLERLRRNPAFRLGAILVCGLGLAGAATTLVRVSHLALDQRLESRREDAATSPSGSKQAARPIDPARPVTTAPKHASDTPPPPAARRDSEPERLAALPPSSAMPVPPEPAATATTPPDAGKPLSGSPSPADAPDATSSNAPGPPREAANPEQPRTNAAAPAPAPAPSDTRSAAVDRPAALEENTTPPSVAKPATRMRSRQRVRATFFDPRALRGEADPAPRTADKVRTRPTTTARVAEPSLPPGQFRRTAAPAGSGPNVRAYSLVANEGRVDATGTRVLTIRVK